MNIDLIWPRISDKASARGAVEGGAIACAFIAVADAGIGGYSLISRQALLGYDAWVLVDGAIFALISWGLLKNSRTWSVIGLLLIALNMADGLYENPRTFGAITVILFLVILSATRGTFAFHKYDQQEKAFSSSQATQD